MIVNGQDRHGRWYEEFTIGDVILHWPGRTITDADNQGFTLMTGNLSATHIDAAFAQGQGHRGCLVNGGLVLSIVHGLSVLDLSSAPKAIAQLGWTDVRIFNPTYPGDTLYAASRVLDKRPSKSHEDRGIINIQTRGVNHAGELIIEYARTILVHKRPSDQQPPPHQALFADWIAG